MTAPSLSIPRSVDGSEIARRLQPAEGWATLAAVAVLAMTFAWSLDDAGWIPLVQGTTAYLPWLALLATAVGIVLAKAGLGRLRTDLVGAIIGGLFVPFVAGSVLIAERNPGLGIDDILARYRAAGDVAVQVWLDLAWNGQPFTNEFGHYHMIFAGLVWAAGLLAANAVVGRHRPLDAVVVTGLLLLTNEALTAHEQLPILVVFSLAAMTLLIRTHVLEEQLTWVRRRIGDPATVSGLYLRGGTMFIGVAVLGALLLTGTASSAPLQGIWSDFPQKVAEISRFLQRIAPGGGQTRGGGIVGFGPSAVTNGLWSPDQNQIAFTAHLPANDKRGYKWRAGTYAVYTLYGWEWGTTHDIQRAERAPLLTGTGDDPVTDIARSAVRILIEPQGYVDSSVLSPQTIAWVDRPSTVLGVGEQNRFATVEIPGTGPYTIEALVQNLGDATSGLTENRLRAAGRNYPTDVTATYLQVPDNAIGPEAQGILDQVEASLGGKDAAETRPYDLARALEAYFRDPANFTYATDVRSEVRAQCAGGISTVECFARIRRGYCEYYASAMTILLRAAGIPARVAYGFLPGARDASGTELVAASAAHWWVEVYFPRNGWVEFDPTGGGQGQIEVLESGAPVTPPPSGLFTSRPDDRETDVIPRGSGSAGGGGGVTRATGSGPFILVGGILLVAIVLVAYAARRRNPHKPMHPDQAWGGLGRLAGRFGFGPRPQQTVYEYAGALGDVVPAARVELTTVARAKVEVAYGRRELGEDRLRIIGDAYRRLRLAVLRAGIGRRLPRPFRRKRR
ncbi:MAG: transglutaminase domain-containing protein [Chloroflexi bacterium]|nr:transglutaminase domain-containing protein [Chloroflexota bacterium]